MRPLLLALALTWPAPAPAVSRPVGARHCLWKIQGEHNHLYLLGSIHLLKPENYPLPAALELAYSNSPVVVFETDLGKLDTPAAQQRLLRDAELPPAETLRQQLAPDAYERLHQLLRDAGLPDDTLDRLKAAVAAVALQELELQQFGFSSDYGVDRHFYVKALRDHKTIVTLEDIDFQERLLTGFSPEEGEALMLTSLEELGRARKIFGELLQAWQTGDLQSLERLLNRARAETPSVFQRLVLDRNLHWADRLASLLESRQDAVVIVGAGHIAGPGGLLDLLSRRGFSISQE